MLGSVHCKGGKRAALNTQSPVPETYRAREGDHGFPPPARGDKAQQAVADGCLSITYPEANKDKAQRETAGEESRSSHVTRKENNCGRDILCPERFSW